MATSLYSPKVHVKSDQSVVVIDRFRKAGKKGFATVNKTTMLPCRKDIPETEFECEDKIAPVPLPSLVLNDFISQLLDQQFLYEDWSMMQRYYDYEYSETSTLGSDSGSDQDSWG
jgi:hypothetical protein